MRLDELRNYFLNDFSQVMYSKSGSSLFNTYFLLGNSGTENKLKNSPAFENKKQVIECNRMCNMV